MRFGSITHEVEILTSKWKEKRDEKMWGWTWRCSCGADASGINYRSYEEAVKRAQDHALPVGLRT